MNIFPESITEEDELKLSSEIATVLMPIRGRPHGSRCRILRFGYDYDGDAAWLGDIPEWIPKFDEKFPEFNSVTINEYRRGQAIGPHIDSKMFGDIAILSLLAEVIMRFTSPFGEQRNYTLLPRSLAIMSGELRHRWQHETLPLDANRRLSVVFRNRIV